MQMNDGCAVLIAFASWEDRFAKGVHADLEAIDCREVVVFYFSSYSPITGQPREHVREECRSRDLHYDEIELDPTQPQDNLRRLDATISSLDDAVPIVVDITTMPREIIWSIFWLCEYREGSFGYRYHSPQDYSDDWLSRDPGRPRLVQKLSGIASPQAKTVLMLAVGYDFQRVSQLIRFFEPSKLILGLQSNSPFPHNDAAMQRYVNELRGGETCETFPIDAFHDDLGYRAVESQLQDIVENHNVILGSLGPKLSAISLYRIRQQWPQAGLVYAPANEFNKSYSRGIGRSYQGLMK